jgi:hypothetical protein
MLLGTGEKLRNPRGETLGEDKVFASEEVLAYEEAEDLDEMREQGDLLDGEIMHCIHASVDAKTGKWKGESDDVLLSRSCSCFKGLNNFRADSS